jgi:hypothetical protein
LPPGKQFQSIARLRTPAGWRGSGWLTGAQLIDIAVKAFNGLQVTQCGRAATESRKGELTAKNAKVAKNLQPLSLAFLAPWRESISFLRELWAAKKFAHAKKRSNYRSIKPPVIFFMKSSPAILTEAVQRTQKLKHAFGPAALRRHASRFSRANFKSRIKESIEAKLRERVHISNKADVKTAQRVL